MRHRHVVPRPNDMVGDMLKYIALTMWAACTPIILAACTSEKQDEHDIELPIQRVTVITAEARSPIRRIEIMGTVHAADSATIAARISGNIIEMPVKLGSRVDAGDLLVVLSAGEISAKLMQARAQHEQALRNLTRERSLLKKKASTPETVKTLAERAQIAEAVLQEVRTMHGYTRLDAPFAGVITRKTADIGDLATPGTPLLQLENQSRLQVIADIPESLIRSITKGDTLPITIPAADRTLSGTVVEIAPTADPKSRTVPIKLAIEPETHIRAGQFARVGLPGAKGAAVMIPLDAVLTFGQMDRVYLVRDGKARLQLVKTGLTHEGEVEIISGVRAGDEVVVSGHRRLQHGQSVTNR